VTALLLAALVLRNFQMPWVSLISSALLGYVAGLSHDIEGLYLFNLRSSKTSDRSRQAQVEPSCTSKGTSVQ